MLVLTRKSKQSIMIGDDIEVSVLSVMGDKVRIGIEAPTAVPVFRTEIYLEIHGEQGDVGEDELEQIESAIDDALHGRSHGDSDDSDDSGSGSGSGSNSAGSNSADSNSGNSG